MVVRSSFIGFRDGGMKMLWVDYSYGERWNRNYFDSMEHCIGFVFDLKTGNVLMFWDRYVDLH
jgi:hypothetical protein